MSHPLTIIKFDEQLISTVEGWELAGKVVSEHAAASRKILLVVPPGEGDKEKLLNLVQEAKSSSQATLARDENTNATVLTFGVDEEDEDSFQDGFSRWKHNILNLCERLGLDLNTLSSASTQTVQTVAKQIKTYLQALEQLLLGVSLTKEATPRTIARIISIASEVTSRIGVCYLQEKVFKNTNQTVSFFDCKKVLETVSDVIKPEGKQEHFLDAYCDSVFFDASAREKLESIQHCNVLVTQGNTGADVHGNVTVFGKHGSDFAYLAAKLGAKNVELWTSGNGIFTCMIPANSPLEGARVIHELKYDEAQEIAATITNVIHPQSIRILEDNDIVLSIKSATLYGKSEGTVISKVPSAPQAKCICLRTGIILISIDSLSMWQQVGFLADVFGIFKRYNLSIDLVATSEANVTVTLDTSSENMDSLIMKNVIADLKSLECRVETKGPCASVSFIGRDIKSVIHKMGKSLEFFEKVQTYLISQSASDVNVTLIVEQSQARDFVNRFHEHIFKERTPDSVIGKTWKELFSSSATTSTSKPETEGSLLSSPTNVVSGPAVWWRQKREQLLQIAAKETPLYVYDEATLEKSAQRLLKLKQSNMISNVFFAMKANNNPRILTIFENLGLGFECVSLEEVSLVLSLFPSIDRKRILFTPNFAPRSEYEKGFELEVHVTLDNIYPLEEWPEVFTGKEIFVRMDPGVGQGHHKKVKTAGVNSKFGVPTDEHEKLEQLCKQHNVKIVGLHAHVGSGILTTPETWKNTGTFLYSLCERFRDVKFIDLGGGLGVPYRPTDQELDIDKLEEHLQVLIKHVNSSQRQVQFFLEPGRFLVANSCVIVAKTTQIKQKAHHYYVGIDTGMNALIRPSLYNSYHEIVNLTRIDEPCVWENTDIVGPICETGDILGQGRKFPATKGNDVIVICGAGAYGKCMSSNYNLRKTPQEIFLAK